MKIWLDYQDRKALSHSETAAILQDIAHVCDVVIHPDSF